MKFIFYNAGDWSVGIPSFSGEIEFPYIDENEDLDWIKGMINDLYDIGKNGYVMTEKELVESEKAEREFEEQLDKILD